MDVNFLTDWTNQEIDEKLGGGFKKTFLNQVSTFKATGESADQVDWRSKGAVGAVRDQGSCGSCWAFSASAALESAYYIANGEMLEISP